jgi:Phage tail tube protein
VRGYFKVQPNNFQWEGVAGQDGVHGHNRVPVIPMVEANVSDDCPLSLQDLAATVDEMVTVDLDGGKNLHPSAGVAQLDTGEGQIDVKFEALTAKDLCICGTPYPLEEMRARATGLAAAVCYAVGTDTEGVTPPCPRA